MFEQNCPTTKVAQHGMGYAVGGTIDRESHGCFCEQDAGRYAEVKRALQRYKVNEETHRL